MLGYKTYTLKNTYLLRPIKSYLDISKRKQYIFGSLQMVLLNVASYFSLNLKSWHKQNISFLIQYSREFSNLSTRIVSRYMELVHKQVIKIIT